MTRAEFLESLRRALNGNMSAAAVEDNIQFYSSYFSSQTARGRSEADVLNELGDPRILARTLIDAAERAGDARAHEANETQYRTSNTRTEYASGSAYRRVGDGQGRSAAGQSAAWNGQSRPGADRAFRGSFSGDPRTQEGGREHRVFRIPGWLLLVIILLILFVVISAVSSLVWMLLPYVIPVILVVYIVKLIGKK